MKYLNLNSGEKTITTLPMNYTYGLSVINSHLFVGATILLTDKGLMQKGFWLFLRMQKLLLLAGFLILMRCFRNCDLRGWSYLSSDI